MRQEAALTAAAEAEAGQSGRPAGRTGKTADVASTGAVVDRRSPRH